MDVRASNQTRGINCKGGEALRVALKHRDKYTQNHCERVVKIAIKTGEYFDFDKESLFQLAIAAKFHDIGKIGIPDRILFNPGKLTVEEYSEMKAHSAIGANIVKKLDIPNADNIAEIILHHHEHFDGSGYPNGLRGKEISLSSRIIRVIDVFDALCSHRLYRKPTSSEKALTIMANEMAGQFDPSIYNVVSKVIEDHSF